jgi:hypothetical protein
MERKTMVQSISSATARCRVCGYEPVAYDARACPHCAAASPNPGIGNRYAGYGVILGGIIGALVCGIWAWLGFGNPHPVGALVLAALGSLPGMFVGLLGGLVVAAVARLFGVR